MRWVIGGNVLYMLASVVDLNNMNMLFKNKFNGSLRLYS